MKNYKNYKKNLVIFSFFFIDNFLKKVFTNIYKHILNVYISDLFF